jgi:hypothetical protein
MTLRGHLWRRSEDVFTWLIPPEELVFLGKILSNELNFKYDLHVYDMIHL